MVADKDKYMEYQLLIQQLQQLHENINTLERHIIDLAALGESLNSIEGAKKNQEVLMPFGGGIFLRGMLADSEKVVMNVGANVCVEKTTNDSKAAINNQAEEIKMALEHLQNEAAKMTFRLRELQEEFNKTKASEK